MNAQPLTSVQNLNQTFKTWIQGGGKSETTAERYSAAIEGKLVDLAKFVKFMGIKSKTLKKNNGFKKFCDTYDTTKQIYEANQKCHQMYRRALMVYADYIENMTSYHSTKLEELQKSAERLGYTLVRK